MRSAVQSMALLNAVKRADMSNTEIRRPKSSKFNPNIANPLVSDVVGDYGMVTKQMSGASVASPIKQKSVKRRRRI